MIAALPARAALLSDGFKPSDLPGLALWLDASQGLLSDGAASFDAATNESLSIADTAAISWGNVNAWGSFWVFFSTLVGNAYVLSKSDADSVPGLEYRVRMNAGGTRPSFTISTGAGAVGVTADTFGDMSAGQWYHVFIYQDFTSLRLGIAINGGAFDTVAIAAGAQDSNKALTLGAQQPGTGAYLNGRMAGLAMGKNPVGGFSAVTPASIRDSLYNGGLGKRARDISAAESTAWGVQALFDLNEVSGSRVDAYQALTLTDFNTVTAAPGPISGIAGIGDIVTTILDRSGLGNYVTQATGTKKATLQSVTNGGRTFQVLRFDDVDDGYASPANSAISGDAAFTLWAVAKINDSVSNFAHLLGFGTPTGTRTAAVIEVDKSTHDRLDLATGNGFDAQSADGSYSALYGAFAVLVITKRPGVINATTTIYLNGIPQAISGDAGTPNITNAPFALGAGKTGLNSISGDWATGGVYNRELSPSEVARLVRWGARTYGVAGAA